MKKWIINIFSSLVLIMGILVMNSDPLKARHEQWHEGPSCGECHCQVGQDCTVNVHGSCGCFNPEESN